MTITLTEIDPVTGEAAAGATGVVLGDDAAGDVIVDPPLLVKVRRSTEERELAFSENEFAIGRGNRVRGFGWMVSREHETAAAAIDFHHGHEADVPMNCKIQIEDLGVRVEYSRAVVSAVEFVEHYGRATTVRYTVTGARLAETQKDQL
ncbi:MAG: hypothetical protein ABFD89_05175 [Bryobacteraceae bacterium]